MNCAVVGVYHAMVGCDFHQELSPTVPPLPVPMPHIVGAIVGNGFGLLAGTVKYSDNVLMTWAKMPIILQGSDIGPLIPHVPVTPFVPSPLTITNTMFSGSTSEFFAFSVKAKGKPVAIANGVYVTANLNCGFPCSTPLNLVIVPSTVFAGFRLGDFIAGLVGMALDVALSWAINAAFNGTSLKGNGGLLGTQGLLSRYMTSRIAKIVLEKGLQNPFFQPFIGSFGGLGSPIGYSNSDTTILGHWYEPIKSGMTQGIADYFNPPPGATMQ